MSNPYLQYDSGEPILLREIDHLELINLRRDLRAALHSNAPLVRGALGGDLALALQAVEYEYDRRFDEATAAYRAKRQQNGRTTAVRTDEALWRQIVREVTADDKGGKAGQWSARKAQIAVAHYKAAGGGYVGPKSTDNSLSKWTHEKWRTKSGKPSLETGERYLPEAAIDALTDKEYAETSRAKRKGMREGRQFVSQPLDISEKTAKYRQSNTGDNMRQHNPYDLPEIADKLIDCIFGKAKILRSEYRQGDEGPTELLPLVYEGSDKTFEKSRKNFKEELDRIISKNPNIDEETLYTNLVNAIVGGVIPEYYFICQKLNIPAFLLPAGQAETYGSYAAKAYAHERSYLGYMDEVMNDRDYEITDIDAEVERERERQLERDARKDKDDFDYQNSKKAPFFDFHKPTKSNLDTAKKMRDTVYDKNLSDAVYEGEYVTSEKLKELSKYQSVFVNDCSFGFCYQGENFHVPYSLDDGIRYAVAEITLFNTEYGSKNLFYDFCGILEHFFYAHQYDGVKNPIEKLPNDKIVKLAQQLREYTTSVIVKAFSYAAMGKFFTLGKSNPKDLDAEFYANRASGDDYGVHRRRNNPFLNIFTQFILVDAGKGNEAVVDGHPHDRYTLICLNPQSSGRSTYYSYLGFGPGVDEHGEFTEADFEKLKSERYKSLGKPISIADLPQKLQGVAQRFMQSCVQSGRSSNPIDMDWGDDDGYDDAVKKISEARRHAVEANYTVKELLEKKRKTRGNINSGAIRELFFAIMLEAGTAKLLAEEYAVLADIVDDSAKIDEARKLFLYAAEVEEEHMGY